MFSSQLKHNNVTREENFGNEVKNWRANLKWNFCELTLEQFSEELGRSCWNDQPHKCTKKHPMLPERNLTWRNIWEKRWTRRIPYSKFSELLPFSELFWPRAEKKGHCIKAFCESKPKGKQAVSLKSLAEEKDPRSTTSRNHERKP